MRIALVHNTAAGDGHPSRHELLQILRSGGFEPDYRSVSEDGWQQVLRGDPAIEAVVVGGGDGTVRKVVHEMYGSDIPIAVMPLGTANNMAHALGAHADPECIISLLQTKRTVIFDLGRVDGFDDEQIFIEAMGIGFLAETMRAVDAIKQDGQHPVREEKRAALEMMYLQASESEAVELEIMIDGRDHSGCYLLAEIMNIECAGSNFLLAPGADPSDGKFDVVLITDEERDCALEYIQRLIDGEDARPEFTVYHATDVTMSWQGSTLHVDDRLWPGSGECPPGSQVRITIDSAKAKFLAGGD